MQVRLQPCVVWNPVLRIGSIAAYDPPITIRRLHGCGSNLPSQQDWQFGTLVYAGRKSTDRENDIEDGNVFA
ncbi:MAG: hypothetical protein WCI02_00835 [Planctomycetota bacterium]